MRLFQVGVLLVREFQLFLVPLMHLRRLQLVNAITLLQVGLILLLRLTHLVFVVRHRLLVLLFPFSVVGLNELLDALRSLSETLRAHLRLGFRAGAFRVLALLFLYMLLGFARFGSELLLL